METVTDLARTLVEIYTARDLKIATAESCTGGMIAAALTDIPGSSAVFDRGFVTYSNEAKQEMLGVPAELIAQHGAVSEVVARAMAGGALERSRADIAVSVTGIAGPGGGLVEKPVGTVWFGVAVSSSSLAPLSLQANIISETRQFTGSRSAIRHSTVEHALHLLFSRIA